MAGNAKFNGQMVPAIKAHGQVTQSGHDDAPSAYYGGSPGGTDGASSPGGASMYEDPNANLSVDSIIEAQVQTMMKCVK